MVRKHSDVCSFDQSAMITVETRHFSPDSIFHLISSRSNNGVAWFPASSLEIVEGVKIG